MGTQLLVVPRSDPLNHHCLCCVSTKVHFPYSVSDDKTVSSAPNVPREKVTKPQPSITQHSSAPHVRREKDTKPRSSVTQHRQKELRQETTVQQLLTDISQQISQLRQEKNSQIQQLQQQLAEVRREKEARVEQVQQQLADLRREKEAQIQQLQLHLSDV